MEMRRVQIALMTVDLSETGFVHNKVQSSVYTISMDVMPVTKTSDVLPYGLFELIRMF
jgi:hypothetical protein